MSEKEHPGLKALVSCNAQVKISIRNNMDDIALLLWNSGIINLELHKQVTNPQSHETPEGRATLVYQRLQDMVQEDEKYYGLFVNYLRKHDKKYEKTISMLDSSYTEYGGKEYLKPEYYTSCDIEEKTRNLEEEFSRLTLSLLQQLKNENKVVDDLTSIISTLPGDIKVYVYDSWLKIVEEKSFKNLDALFSYLNAEVWTFLDYYLVRYIIGELSNKNLIVEMDAYVHSLQEFKQRTLVKRFINCWRGHCSDVPGYEIFQFKIKDNNTNYTLARLDDLWEILRQNCFPSLSDCAACVFYNHFGEGCFIVTLLFPNLLAKLFMGSFSHCDKLEELKVFSKSLEGRVIYKKSSAKHAGATKSSTKEDKSKQTDKPGYAPPAGAAYSEVSKSQCFVLEMPATVPDDDSKVIIDSNISGLVFKDVDDNELKDYGFAVLKKVGNTNPDSVVVPAPAPVEEERPTQDEQPLASDGGFNREKSARFPAMDRGTYKPMLKFKSTDEIAKLKPKKELIIPRLANGYYPMQGKKHGVCLIINNKTFKDSKHRERRGTDRDEYNLIETWRYLGYHVEVRREAKHREIMDIFYDIDELLHNINAKTQSQVEHDSFVCCILSHGNKFCFYSSDSKEVKIDYMERALGASTVLRDKPKMFFIQACQGEGLGTAPVSSKLHMDTSGLQADSEVQTSRRADIYISYATAQGDQSYRHIEKGSWYIGVVCLTLCEESRQSSINELQKFINKGVADREDHVFVTEVGEYRQQPSCSDQLRRNVHFFFESTSS